MFMSWWGIFQAAVVNLQATYTLLPAGRSWWWRTRKGGVTRRELRCAQSACCDPYQQADDTYDTRVHTMMHVD